MTKEEILIQLALGTLPVWKRVELGDIEVKEKGETEWETFEGPGGGIRITIECAGIRYFYEKNIPGSKKKAIKAIVNYLKNNEKYL